MAIEKTGVEVDLTSEFENPTSFEENGMVDHVDIDGLSQLTNYYVRGFLVQDGQKTYSDNILDFTTDIDLPSELQRVEYLESDGDCYILLNIPTQDITEIQCKCTGYSSQGVIFGVKEQGDELLLADNSHGKYMFRFFSSHDLDSTQNSIDFLDFSYKDDIANFNGEQILNPYQTNPISLQLLLFGVNNEGNYELQDHCKIHEFRSNLCFLVPCYVKPGETIEDVKGQTCFAGECGFYDVLNQCFYSNDGTSMFIPGPDL